MSSEADKDTELKSGRPDPFFKVITRQEAEQLGIEASESELHSTRTDMVLKVPPSVVLEGTMFDFFQAHNVIEFKEKV